MSRRSKQPARRSFKDIQARADARIRAELPAVWQPIQLPAYMFRPGDKVRRTALSPDHKISNEVGTVTEILPPEGTAVLGCVVVHWPDKQLGENTFAARLTFHMGGNLIKVVA